MHKYILVIMSTSSEFPDLTTRFIEVEKVDGNFIILKSEYDYLGKGKIVGDLEEDQYGLSNLKFLSNEEEPREFFCDDADSSDYIIGDILVDGVEVGEFVLRNISTAEL